MAKIKRSPCPRERGAWALTMYFRGLLTLGFLLLPIVGLAEERPQICTGFNPETGNWGTKLRPWEHLCPDNYGMLGTNKPRGPGRGVSVSALGICCPLPSKDILTSNHIFVGMRCPENFIATGAKLLQKSALDPTERQIHLRCTEINIDKYALTKAEPGAAWGFDSSSAFFWKERLILKMSDLPPAHRDGLRRRDLNEFHDSGCVSWPYGGLLVGKYNKRCKDIVFSRLLRKEIRNGLATTKPVIMYPQCRYVSDLFSEKAFCVE